jgi:ABC-type amino acid transport substrate-binding protein
MNRILKILICAVQISLTTFVFSYSILAETFTIRASKHDFPATYIKDNNWEGMDIALIKEILLRAKLNYQIVEMPFKRSLAQIKNGKIALIPNLVKNEKRSVYLDWLGPVRITCIGLVVLKKDEDMPIDTIDDLIKIAKQKKKKFGYVNGASYSELFDHRLKNDPALAEVLYILNDNTLKLKMLKVGRMIGYFSDEFEIRQRILDQEFSHQYKGLVLHSYRIEQSCSGAYFGVSKKLDERDYQKLTTAFQSMRDDGTFTKIHLNWVGFKPTF